MTKQLKRILIGLLVLAVVVGGLLIVMFAIPKPKTSSTSSSSSTNTNTISLISMNETDLSSVHVTNSNGEFTINRGSDGSYSVKELSGAPYYSSDVEACAKAAIAFKAQKVIEQNASKLSTYGLDKPTMTIDVTDKNGNTRTVYVGNSTPGTPGEYVMLKGSNTVYMVYAALGDYFSYKPIQFENLSLLTIETANYKKLTAMTFGGTSRAAQIKLVADTSQAATSDGWYSFKMTAPKNYALDTSQISTITASLPALKADSAESMDMSAANLAKYGLANPSSTFTVTYDGKDYTFSFGNTVADGSDEYIYLTMSGRNVIYKIKTSTITYYNWQTFDLINRSLITATIDNVKSVKVQYSGKTCEFDLSGTDTSLAVKNNNVGIDVTNFRKYFMELVGVTAQGTVTGTPSSTPMLTVTFTYRDGSKAADVVNYYTLSSTDRQVLFDYNGNRDFYASKPTIDKIVSDTSLVIANKTITLY